VILLVLFSLVQLPLLESLLPTSTLNSVANHRFQLAVFGAPFHRMFTLDNVSIQYPHAQVERVPAAQLFLYSLLLPLAVLVAWSVTLRPGWHKAHVTILGLLVSVLLTGFLTEIIKVGVGRPRPDLIARCKPLDGTPDSELITFEACSETDYHTLHDGFKSFPSGHSSTAWAGLGYLSM
jgi:diacylglycerol diphosphate phosphatase / phosphatidate phosphatase